MNNLFKTYYMKRFTKYIIPILIIAVNGCKKEEQHSVPTLSTTEISSITYSSCYSGGIIKSEGTFEILSKGVCWDTTSHPTIENNITNEGSGKDNFTSKISGLTPNTKYFVRAYATNQSGTGYGNEIQFTTLGPIPSFSSIELIELSYLYARIKSNLTSDGGNPILYRGICWSLNHNPTFDDNKILNGTGLGSYISKLNDLLPNTKYYARAFANNIAGTGYSDEIQFTTLGSIPTITTIEITDTSYFSAKCSSNLINNGGLPIVNKGVCWSTNQNPTLSDFKTIESNNLGSFVSLLSDLNANTTYFVRAYASNSVGTSYGNSISFTTKPLSTVQDIDGNVYNTIQIGTKIWTIENLKTTHFANGDSIPAISNNNDWKTTSSGALCYYDNVSTNVPSYGILYNWYAVEDSRNLCPSGWHVPDENEWYSLINSFGGTSVAGGKLKSIYTTPHPEPRWDSPNISATNESGFSGIPSGSRNSLGNYSGKGNSGYWWYGNAFNPDQSSYLLLKNNSSSTDIAHFKKTYGLSVRCVKN